MQEALVNEIAAFSCGKVPGILSAEAQRKTGEKGEAGSGERNLRGTGEKGGGTLPVDKTGVGGLENLRDNAARLVQEEQAGAGLDTGNPAGYNAGKGDGAWGTEGASGTKTASPYDLQKTHSQILSKKDIADLMTDKDLLWVYL